MMLAVVLLAVSALFASGVLFRHQRWLTYAAAAGVIFEGRWLVLTLLDRTAASSIETTTVFTAGALVMLLAWLPLYKRWSLPAWQPGGWRREIAVVLVLAAVLAGAGLVLSANGWRDGAWVTHGFYNGDTMTLISLVQRAMLVDGLSFGNPFAAGGALEYPTLAHAGIATGLQILNTEMAWLHMLPLLTYVQILLTVPLFFLLWDVLAAEPAERWQRWFGVRGRWLMLLLQAGVVFGVMAASWDSYIYPQTHFFLSGLYLLLVSLLASTRRDQSRFELLSAGTASAVALVLMLSNAVTGTAAVALIVLYYGLQVIQHGAGMPRRLSFAAGIALWMVLYVLFTPGNASFGAPHFSYTSAESMMRLAPLALLLLVGVFAAVERERYLSAAVVLLFMMSFFTFFFSTRNIVVANAERFIYHALLVGFPLLLVPVLRCLYYVRRLLVFTSLTLPQRAAGIGAAAAGLLIIFLPGLISGARAHDHLMFQDERVVSLETVEALEWIEEMTDPQAVFLASPDAPWAIPMFTGRALLRADYWLGLEDEVLDDVGAAFAGDSDAQERALRQADYAVLPSDELRQWQVDNHERVFTNSAVSIFRISPS